MSKDEEGMRKILSAVACLAVAEKISDPSSWLPREDFPDFTEVEWLRLCCNVLGIKAGLLNRAASYGNNVEKIAEMASDIWLSETTS